MTLPFPRTPGSLGPSIAVPSTLRTPRRRQTTPLPPETALMGIYPAAGTGGPRLPPSSPSESSSPPRWAESAGSEVGPDPDGDGSEYTGRSGGPWLCGSRLWGSQTFLWCWCPPAWREVCPNLCSVIPAHCAPLPPQLTRTRRWETGAVPAPVATPRPWPGARAAPCHPPKRHPPPSCPPTCRPSTRLTVTCWAPVWSVSEWPCPHTPNQARPRWVTQGPPKGTHCTQPSPRLGFGEHPSCWVPVGGDGGSGGGC